MKNLPIDRLRMLAPKDIFKKKRLSKTKLKLVKKPRKERVSRENPKKNTPKLTMRQLTAARVLLGWNQAKLAKKTKLSSSYISYCETKKGFIEKREPLILETLRKAGVEDEIKNFFNMFGLLVEKANEPSLQEKVKNIDSDIDKLFSELGMKR